MTKNNNVPQQSLKQRISRYTMMTLFSLFIMSIMLTLPLRWFNPVTSMFIMQEMFADKKVIHLAWEPYDNIAKTLPIAVVASEDQKFPDHFGFDFDSLFNALTENRQQTRGASTLSQQLAKNLFLWSGRSLVRKGLEAYFTILLELFLPKRRILEIYLNVVEFGPAVYGVGAASEKLLFRSPARISAHQAALLAAVLPNPKRMSVRSPSSYVFSRAAQIQQEVRQLGGAAYLKNL